MTQTNEIHNADSMKAQCPTLFFELIRIALGRQETFSHQLSEEDWHELYAEAKQQTLLGVLYDGVCRLSADQKPPRQLLINWHASVQKIICDNKRLNHDTVWVSRRWEKLGYRNVILKGQGNALLYPDPMLRVPGDIDIWLDGDRRKIANYVRSHFPGLEVTRIEMEFPVRKDTPIEIHFLPSFLYDPFKDRKMQRYFTRQLASPKQVELPEEGTICVPGDEMNLVFQLSHIYRHLFYEGIGLRQLMDYYYLCTTIITPGNEALRKKVLSVINDLGLMKFCRALMWVLGEVFLMPKEHMLTLPDEHRGRFLLGEVMRAGNFGHADDRVGHWAEMSRLQRLTWGTRWSWRLLGQYPREVFWHPYYRVTQYIWRLYNGYL